jgi:hypothetical protein
MPAISSRADASADLPHLDRVLDHAKTVIIEGRASASAWRTEIDE